MPALGVLLAASAQAQQGRPPATTQVEGSAAAASRSSGPRFSFTEQEDTYDFGKVPEGPEVTHEFLFRNTGTRPLMITDGNASCGCTTPKWPSEPVLPGNTGKILVTFRTEGRPGAFAKTVYLSSNAPAKDGGNKYELYIKGEVTPKVSPSTR